MEKIIDGVNVAGCEHYKNNGKCRIPHYQQNIKYVSCDCNEWDCAYKQFKRLEQENEKLKKQYNDIYDYLQEREKLINGTIQDIYKAKQENEKLRTEIGDLEILLANAESDLIFEENEKLKARGRCSEISLALEEIREIVSEPCVAGENCITCNSNCTNKDILNKINEVLK